MTIAGFTGTQKGMDEKQKLEFVRLLKELDVHELHLGDCIGADTDAYHLAKDCRRIGHPPVKAGKRSFLSYDEERPLLSYRDRNHALVDESAFLIAAPFSEERSNPYSGTWATIRHAIRERRPVHILWAASR